MDALRPASGVPEALPPQGTSSSNRTVEYGVAAGLAILALAVSPVAIRLLTGRPELGFRPLLLSAVFDLFLLLAAGAMLAHGRLRQALFYVLAWVVPFVLLAGLETAAGLVHLTNHVSIIQDLSSIKRGSNWGPGASHFAPDKGGFVVYRPWSGNGVTINELGLRTPSPTPKAPGEYRVAVSGGSNVWGFRLGDDDTIPAMLQAALRRHGNSTISVYNFGIEDANIAKELALLEHYKDLYGIDQVVFFSGGADVLGEYFALKGEPLGVSPDRITSFELYRTYNLIRATWFEPSPDRLARVDKALPRLAKSNRLTEGLLAADDYCRQAKLRCDFVLMPLLATRRSPVGSEVKLLQTFRGMYPHLDALSREMYRSAMEIGLEGRVHDLTHVFDDDAEQVYIDVGHNNEAGHAVIVDALLPIIMSAPGSN
jgi:hypothetical protein